jgi:uncharacterized protein (AIM24 family)
VVHPSGLVLVRIDVTFATRLEAVRAYGASGGAMTAALLSRKSRGRALDEPLGGAAAPLVAFTGPGTVALGARGANRLLVMKLSDESLYLRESGLVGFDGALSYENGRLAVGEGEAVPMIHLRGRGVLIVELAASLLTLEVAETRPITVRREAIVGWTGRLLPHEVPPSETPGAARGMVCFAGDGAVLVLPPTHLPLGAP